MNVKQIKELSSIINKIKKINNTKKIKVSQYCNVHSYTYLLNTADKFLDSKKYEESKKEFFIKTFMSCKIYLDDVKKELLCYINKKKCFYLLKFISGHVIDKNFFMKT